MSSDDEDGGSGGDNGGCGGASNGDNGGPASDTAPNGDTDGNGGSSVEAGGSMDDGRQAAGGGCAIGVWRSRLSGNTHEDCNLGQRAHVRKGGAARRRGSRRCTSKTGGKG